MASQPEKGTAFRLLHQRDHAFIIPNPWDVGTARLLQSFGFEALATFTFAEDAVKYADINEMLA